jgi:hypothetical protein
VDRIVEVMMHNDVYPHLKVDQLPSKEEMIPILKEWLAKQHNYMVVQGPKTLGAITSVPVEDKAVELHGGFFKAAYGQTSRDILNSFCHKLSNESVKAAYLIVPDSKAFVHKLAKDTEFKEIERLDSEIMIDGVNNKVVIYRREI